MKINKNILVWLIIVVASIVIFNIFSASDHRATQELSYSAFLNKVKINQVASVTIEGPVLKGILKEGGRFSTYAPSDPLLVDRLLKNNVTIKAQAPSDGLPTFLAVLINWFPMLLLIGVWIFFMRQMQGGGKGGALGFGKSKARLLTEKSGTVTFDDVAGIDEAKKELEEIVDFLKDPKKYQNLGAKIPKGVLLVGPPGTGKTLVARAVAGEADVPFFTISGSDFVEMFVGVGASRVRDMFEQGKKSAPCILFIDEIDAVGRHRGAGIGGGNDEREQTLNQLLVEMDGFEGSEGVILIAATNRPDVLDPALLRPGRFDRQVVVPNPDIRGRGKILQVHMKKLPLARDVKSEVIARGTPGFSGADLANLVNEAALLAASRNLKVVSMREFEDAKDKIMLGAERRSMMMTEEEKEMTAYHEAGHAVVMLHAKGHEPLHKVTIIPRGRALGVTFYLPERDRLSQKRIELEALIASAFGGRVAEEMIYGPDYISTGASNDIKQATSIARSMVTKYGFSDRLGPLLYSDEGEDPYARSDSHGSKLSDETARIIDEEVKKFVLSGELKAREILKEYRHELETLAKGLLEHETLERDDITALLEGKSLESDRHDVKAEDSYHAKRRSSKKKNEDTAGSKDTVEDVSSPKEEVEEKKKENNQEQSTKGDTKTKKKTSPKKDDGPSE